MDAEPIICLVGPTASGKTALAIELASQLPVEIVSVDSAMVYRSMTIGTAKPAADILERIPHHLIDIRDPAQTYSAGEFREEVLPIIDQILAKQRIPLLVGGTMLYFHVLKNGIALLPKSNRTVRQRLQCVLEKQGLPVLYQRLQTIDPDSARRIHPHDTQRLLRALEVCEITGKTLSTLQRGLISSALPYRLIMLAIMPHDRDAHRQLIAKRLQAMFNNKFVEEVEFLHKRRDLHAGLPAMRTIGYRQLWQYLDGTLDYDTMKEHTLIATCQLVKRQLTWLRSWETTEQLQLGDPSNLEKSIRLIKQLMSKQTKKHT